ncbi:pyridoxal-phosphate dependent enzyme [Pontivivens insulae]|uniref:Diaminopropionate ammonia-lyase n=1 Tax=Pontivivens insulae TaxID=1639689 RepID=A0A2R8A8T9_9RHOB|nr:pyridoxal-phosphate dependent enzyme [Pontivivens insulae]RED18746.1 diaminopropionate ammonia-lyase [Pontivivens insulae]SPF28644.1 Diaminopropionate ammonia-lyase [Pontivivens insulae]
METLLNPYRFGDAALALPADVPFPSVEAARAQALVARCPHHAPTPLARNATLETTLGVAEVWVKDERARMGLGSFKALGAAYVIACDAQEGAAAGRTYVTASAGNHGLSVAAGAQAFGAKAVIYLSDTVPEAFAHRLRQIGAEVVRAGSDYEQSMTAASDAATTNGWSLLSDSSWQGYTAVPHRLMEGYLVLMAEVIEALDPPPTHLFLQAGVGGLAGAAAALARSAWGDGLEITVVEPEAAPALQASIRAGKAVHAPGPVSAMGRLDCKEPSLIALKGLARDANHFATLSEEEGHAAAALASRAGLPSTPSGTAGLGGAMGTDLPATARVLLIFSEGPEA